MNRNLNRRIHPIAEADGLSPKKPRKDIERLCDILDVEIKEREFKENKKKNGQKWMLW